MGKSINVGLIGAGRLGIKYAEFLKTRVRKANLVAVADIIPQRAVECSEKFDIQKKYFSHQELNDDKEIEAVVVAATTSNHRDIVVDAASKGKAILCEKPIALDLNEAREMKAAVQKYKVFYQQGFMRRFDRGFSSAKKKIDEGLIGKPVAFWATSRDPYLPSLEFLRYSGKQIIDSAIHDIDIARWYMGEFSTVYSIGGILAYPEIEPLGDTDNVIMSIKFESGCLGEIDNSRNGVYGYDINAEVLGTKGTLKIGYLRETPVLVLTKEGANHDIVPYFPERFLDAFVEQLNDFIDNLLNDLAPMIKIEDGIAALQAAVAATASLRENRVVSVKDF